MSRSIKRNPVIKSSNKKGFWKRQANKKVRREDIDSGGQYKKVYNSYDINDYKFHLQALQKRDGIPTYHYLKRRLTLDEIREFYKK